MILAWLQRYVWIALVIGIPILTLSAYVKGRIDGSEMARAQLVEQYQKTLEAVRVKAVADQVEAVRVAIQNAQREKVIERVTVEKIKRVPTYIRDNRSCDLPADWLRERNAIRQLTVPTASTLDGASSGTAAVRRDAAPAAT